jgi:sortase A
MPAFSSLPKTKSLEKSFSPGNKRKFMGEIEKPLGYTNQPLLKDLQGKLSSRKILFLVISVIAVILGFGGGAYYYYTYLREVPKETITEEGPSINHNDDVIVNSTDTPSEEIPDANYNWRGQPTDPKFLRIPSIGVDAFVQKVGVDQNSQIAVPNNIHVVGWFVDSVLPGENGLSIIDGHLDGTRMGGVFRHLAELVSGDTFEIEFGNGTIKQFRVIAVVRVGLDDAEDPLFSQIPTVASQLNLITCGGTYDRATRTYDQRDIVQAEFLGNLE